MHDRHQIADEAFRFSGPYGSLNSDALAALTSGPSDQADSDMEHAASVP